MGKEAQKHRLRVESPIVAEAVFVQIGLEILLADRVINAAYSALDEAPEPLHGVRVNLANHIDLFTVLDALMGIAASFCQRVVRRVLVCENRGRGQQTASPIRRAS